ncbi:MAG: ABC transporter ATP-binding protein [Gaiellales bacterium]
MPSSDSQVLSVRDLVVEFRTPRGPLRAVDGVSFDVFPGEVLGIVGESGSGKSVSMLAIMGLLPAGEARISSGQALFRGRDLLKLSAKELKSLRGDDLAMVFQDPMTSLNPVRRIGTQIGEAIQLHRPALTRREVRKRVVDLLASVGVPNAAKRYGQYPHEFSGGLRQRAMIAMAIANEPELLIADEPTTALDVTIQAQVLKVLEDAREKANASMILISHDLGLIAEVADRVTVMYGGRVMEAGGVHAMFESPHHPYTVGLMNSLPRLDSASETLYSIPGQPPRLELKPDGCVFNPRCDLGRGRSVCSSEVPPLELVRPDYHSACHFAESVPEWSATLESVLTGAPPTAPAGRAMPRGGKDLD